MRVVSLSLAVVGSLVASVALAQDKLKFEPKFAVGDSAKYELSMVIDLGGMEGKLSTNVAQKVKAVGEAVEWEAAFDTVKLIVSGEEQEVPSSTLTWTVKNNLPSKASGGIEGGDAPRMQLMFHPFLPSTEVAAGDKFTVKVPAGDGVGEVTIEATYEGAEESAGKKLHKFSAAASEAGGSFKYKQTYWVGADGKLNKLEGTFDALPVPAMSTAIPGSMKLIAK